MTMAEAYLSLLRDTSGTIAYLRDRCRDQGVDEAQIEAAEVQGADVYEAIAKTIREFNDGTD